MTEQEKILQLANAAGEPLRPQELAERAGGTGATHDAVRALMAQGVLILTPDRRVRPRKKQQ